VVIGSGLSGVMAALRASSYGKKVVVIRKGWGATALSSGAFEISPNPLLPQAFELLKKWVSLRIQGSYEENHLFLSQTGEFKKAAFAMESHFLDFRTIGRKKVLVLGIFSPVIPRPAKDLNIVCDLVPLHASDVNLLPPVLAKRLDHPEEVKKLAQAIKTKFNLQSYAALFLPPILGFEFFSDIRRECETILGLPVYEMLGGSHSVPGLRLQKALESALRKANIPIIQGKVSSFSHEKKKIMSVTVNEEEVLAHHFILATGKFFSGGLYKGVDAFQETVFGLPLFYENKKINETPIRDLVDPSFSKKQPLFQCGVKTNENLVPVNEYGEVVYENLRACGTVLSGVDPYRGGNCFGVQVVTGYRAGEIMT